MQRSLALLSVLLLAAAQALAGATTPAQLDALVAPTIAIQKALAADDVTAAHGAAENLAAQVADLDELSLAATATDALLATDQLEAARQAFKIISDTLLPLFEEHGASSDLYVAFCPMAFGYAGGTWIQAEEEILNPYEGSRMLHCGAIQRKIKRRAE